jgi:hypothetical protein
MAKRNIPAGLVPLGYEKITTNSTVKSLNTTTIPGHAFLISVETQSARIRLDAGAPAASTGILLLAANSPYWFEGVKGSDIKITGAVSGSVVQVMSWKYRGE